ncbi:hypothetical protein [Spiroplasma endosymbiont of Melieria omissa]|uniref:hypothetical protein n=1 Tax=Spiroplasma endosymbiont of Melieria omissa TaxID=3139324 RepID=UPI003CCA7FF4
MDKIFVKCCQPKNKKNEIVLYLEKEKNNNTYNVYYIFALDEENNIKNLNNRDLKEIIEIEKNNLIYFPISIFCQEIFKEKKTNNSWLWSFCSLLRNRWCNKKSSTTNTYKFICSI